MIVTKYKTSHILKDLQQGTSNLRIQTEILRGSRKRTRIIMMAKSRMLLCGKNFKGTLKEICDVCEEVDDENHRINFCKKWSEQNKLYTDQIINFEDIYSDENEKVNIVIKEIENLWDLEYNNNKMKY